MATICIRHEDAMPLLSGRNGANFGGAEAQIIQIARLIEAMPEHQVLFISHEEVPVGNERGIRVVRERLPVRRGVPLLSRWINRQRAKRPIRGVEAPVLFQTIAGPGTIQCYERAKKLGVPYIIRISSDADLSGELLGDADREAYFHALGSASAVIAQTDAQRRRLESERGILAHLVPNIVQVPERPARSQGTKVLWVGRIAPLKRPWMLLELARAFPNYEFVMAGPDHDRMLRIALGSQAEQLTNVRIIGEQPYSAMAQLYGQAALLVGTAAVEGFSNVYLEAAAHGVPVLSLVGSTAIMEGTNGCGWCAHGDFEALKSKLAQLMTDDDGRNRLSRDVHSYVWEHHRPAAVEPMLAHVLDEVPFGARGIEAE